MSSIVGTSPAAGDVSDSHGGYTLQENNSANGGQSGHSGSSSSAATTGAQGGIQPTEGTPDASAPNSESCRAWRWSQAGPDGKDDELVMTAGGCSVYGRGVLRDGTDANGSSTISGDARSEFHIDLMLTGPENSYGFIQVDDEIRNDYSGELQVGSTASVTLNFKYRDVQNQTVEWTRQGTANRAATEEKEKKSELDFRLSGSASSSTTVGVSPGGVSGEHTSTHGIEGGIGGKRETASTIGIPGGHVQPYNANNDSEHDTDVSDAEVGLCPVYFERTPYSYLKATLSGMGMDEASTHREARSELTRASLTQQFFYNFGLWTPDNQREPTDPFPSGGDATPEYSQPQVLTAPATVTNNGTADKNCRCWWPHGVWIPPVFPLPFAAGVFDGRELGTLLIEHPTFAAEDTQYALSCSPAGAVEFESNTLVVEQGWMTGEVRFAPTQSGSITLSATLLDEYGQPTSETLTYDVTVADPDSVTTTEIRAWWDTPMDGVENGSIQIERGATVNPIKIGRLLYDDFVTESTTVTVSTTDPSGILLNVPSSVTIQAGEALAELAFGLDDAVGSATLTLSYGSQSISYDIDTVDPSAAVSLLDVEDAEIAIPAGVRSTFPVALAVASAEDRTVTVTSDNTSVVAIPSGSATLTIPRGERHAVVEFETVGTGSAEIAVTVGELSAITVPVSVRAADVDVARTSIVLSSMTGTEARMGILLVLPAGVEFNTVSGPAGSEAYMSIAGEGTDRLMVTFVEGETRPSSITLSVTFDGAESNGAFDVLVSDGMHSEDYDVTLEYTETVPASGS